MKIVLIGAGNVATHLGIGFKKAEHSIIQVYSRTAFSADTLAKKLHCKSCTDAKDISDEADLYIISLSDHAVKGFLKSFPLTDKVVAHTSGSLPLNIFGKKFKHCGVIYPVQTFSLNRKVNLTDVPFCIEWSDDEAKKKIGFAVKRLSNTIIHINSSKRKHVHLAAVFANNFGNHLLTISEKLMADAGLAYTILCPLILETALKVQTRNPYYMQTGPARRGDSEIIEAHLKMLGNDKELHTFYKLFTESISELYGIKL